MQIPKILFIFLNFRNLPPVMLGLLIRYFNGEDGFSAPWQGWLFATGVLLPPVHSFLHHQALWQMVKVAMDIRVASCALVYRKVNNHRVEGTLGSEKVKNDMVQ